MRIHIDTVANSTALSDVENFKALDATIKGPRHKASGLHGIVRQDQTHVWFDIEALAALAGAKPKEWRDSFDKMIDYARTKGWVDHSANAVRVHIDS